MFTEKFYIKLELEGSDKDEAADEIYTPADAAKKLLEILKVSVNGYEESFGKLSNA